MDRRGFIQLAGKAGAVLLLLRQPEPLFAISPEGTAYQKQLELISQIRLMADKLGMNIGKDFYTEWDKHGNSFYCLLYISMPYQISPEYPDDKRNWQSISGVVASGNTAAEGLNPLIKTQKLYIEQGYHTMLYKTAGQSDARLNTVLLNYPLESIAFILFHEATHRHISSVSTYMPYIFNEACADVVGNHATLEFAKHNSKYFSLQTAKNQLYCMEQIDKCIISATEKYEKKEYILQDELYKNCHDDILKYFPAGNQFFIDRYDYSVNNAYFLRYKSYTHYYFLQKKALHKMGLNEFIPFINLLPNNEEDVKELLEIVSR